jgi:hypothetical protein
MSGKGAMRFWTPGHETEFQNYMAFDPGVRQWRNAFTRKYGEAPEIEGGDYDYRRGYIEGARPQATPGDSVPHWGSQGKAANHPTAWKEDFMRAFGVDPDTVTDQQVTPAMQQFLRKVLGR